MANPCGYILRCGIEIEYLIEVLMVHPFYYRLFDMAEIDHHAVGIQFFGTATYRNQPIVAMKAAATTFIRQFQTVRRRYFYLFPYREHNLVFLEVSSTLNSLLDFHLALHILRRRQKRLRNASL
jgi:hypothetical protein